MTRSVAGALGVGADAAGQGSPEGRVDLRCGGGGGHTVGDGGRLGGGGDGGHMVGSGGTSGGSVAEPQAASAPQSAAARQREIDEERVCMLAPCGRHVGLEGPRGAMGRKSRSGPGPPKHDFRPMRAYRGRA